MLCLPRQLVRRGSPVSSWRSSRSASAMSIDGSGPPRSRAARRRAASNRSSESMIWMSRMRGEGMCEPAAAHFTL